MIAVIAVIAASSSLFATRAGVGIDADSAAYLGTAQNIVEGRGVSVPFTLFTDEYAPREAAAVAGEVPLTHFPPAYPMVLAAIASIGIDVEHGARLLGAALLGANVLLLGALVQHVVRSRVARVVVVLLAVYGPVGTDLFGERTWLFQHSQAMSEGLFTTFLLVTLVAVARYRGRPTRSALAAVVAGTALAVATRYSGVALVVVAACAVGILTPGGRRDRLRRAAIVTASVVPTVVWELWVSLFHDAQPTRSLHRPSQSMAALPAVFEGWLGLSEWTTWPRHIVLAALVVIVAIALGHLRSPLLTTIAALVVVYTVQVVVTRAVIDASTPLDDRIFSPLQGPVYALLVGAIAAAGAPLLADRPTAREMLRAVGFGLPIGLFLSATAGWRDLVVDGLPPRRPISATVRATGELPDGALIASNVPTQIWEGTRRGSIRVPLRITAVTNEPNRNFDDEVRELVGIIGEHHGFIVLLGPEAGGFGTLRLVNESELTAFPSVRVFRRVRDGVILIAGCDSLARIGSQVCGVDVVDPAQPGVRLHREWRT